MALKRFDLYLILVLTAFFGYLLPIFTSPAHAHSDRHPIHEPKTRMDYEEGKFLGGDKHGYLTSKSRGDKNGEFGDAAVTSNRYDMLRYGLAMTIEVEEEFVTGSAKMVFASEVTDLSTMVFDFTTSLTISSVEHVLGELTFTHVADSVSVNLPATLSTGAIDSFTVNYSGQPVRPAYRRGLMFDTQYDDSGPIVANVSEPAFAQFWWPCKDRPGDKAYVSLSLTVPDTLTGVSNGILVSQEAAPDNMMTFNWREQYPIAPYLVSVAISNYTTIHSECTTSLGSAIPLRNWVFSADYEDALVDFEPLCDMLDFTENKFGPYPFLGEKYGHAEFHWGGAMEHQTVTSIGTSSIRGDGSRDWLIIHELGHQWFGDSLTPATWADIWLNEGFATYSEALWYEHIDGPAAYLQYLQDSVSLYSWELQGPVYDPMPVFPGLVIYDKGAWIIHMLRLRMGDTAFMGMLQDWTQGEDRKDGTVTTQELINLASTWAGEDLNGFFWPWLTSTTVPQVLLDYKISDGPNDVVSAQATASHVSIALRQVQSTLFDMVYPVVVTTTDGEFTRYIRLNNEIVEQEWDFPDAVTNVQLDPTASLLWEPVNYRRDVPGLVLAYPNPSTGAYVTLRYQLDSAARVVLRVFDAMGRQEYIEDLGQISPEPGYNEVVWNERNSAGVRVSSGVYWVTLEVDGQRSVRKITVLH